MPRLRYIQSEAVAEEDRELARTGFNLHKITLHSPGLARASRAIGLYLRRESPLDPRLRELAILQVAFTLESIYEYAHHLKIAVEEFGVTDSDILAVAIESEGRNSELDDQAKLVLRAARELAAHPELPEETFDGLAAFLPPPQLVDLIYAIGFYVGFVRVTGSFGIEVEPQYEPYLQRFPIRPPLIV